MKLGFLLLMISLIEAKYTIDDEHQEFHDNKNDECADITGVDRLAIDKAYKGEFTDDPKLKHQFYCLCEKFGFFLEGNKFNIPAMKERMLLEGEKNAEEIVNSCITEIGENDAHEHIFQMAQCWYDKSSLVVRS